MNEIVFIPYNPWFYWIVMVIDLFSMDVYWLDSAPVTWKSLSTPVKWIQANRSSQKPCSHNIKGLMQPDGKQCGIHEMRCFIRSLMSNPSPLPLKVSKMSLTF
ncbi:hypothetical protein IFM89_007644 [Coptis chinensis]|uniref:Uncharacterized protein n=1 Tax=Coptis chinensis TaxID=261450 RepID=A0A835LQN6_9MAGN|nr:hypothetical protein IFM89_007644 [Coptis chinensis]